MQHILISIIFLSENILFQFSQFCNLDWPILVLMPVIYAFQQQNIEGKTQKTARSDCQSPSKYPKLKKKIS